MNKRIKEISTADLNAHSNRLASYIDQVKHQKENMLRTNHESPDFAKFANLGKRISLLGGVEQETREVLEEITEELNLRLIEDFGLDLKVPEVSSAIHYFSDKYREFADKVMAKPNPADN